MEKIRDLLDGKTLFSSPESSSHCTGRGEGGREEGEGGELELN